MSTQPLAPLILILLGLAAIPFTNGRASPQPERSPDAERGEHWVVLTHTDIRATWLFGFIGHSQRILTQLENQPGLVAHDARLSVLRLNASTWTAWRDRASLDAFIAEGAHARAQREGSGALSRFRTRTLYCPNGWLPASWSAVEAALKQPPQGCRFAD